MKAMALGKLVGTAILSFGLGVLVSFFLPESFLVVIEALVIVSVGLLFFLHQKC